MNLLLINHYAGAPALGMEYRPYYLAREWVRAGHAVTVVAANFSHVRARQPKAGQEEVDGITYHWLPTPSYQGNGLGRLKNIWSFLRQVWQLAPALVAVCKPDVVIASSTYPMDIWVARRVAKRAGAKLVFEVHDLWPLSPIEIGGMSQKHPFIRVCQAAENAAYRDSDLVVSMLPNIAPHAAAKGLPSHRLAIIPNGIAREDCDKAITPPLRADVQAVLDAARAAGQSVIAYTGAHGLPNALDTLLDAAALLRAEAFIFLLVGDGHERARLQDRATAEGLNQVFLLDPIPKAQVPTLLGCVKAAYLGAPRHPLYRFGVSPNKMLDYMVAKTPIIYAIEAGNNPVAEANCGITIPPDDAAALCKAIRVLSCLPESERQAMGDNGRRYALQHHAYNVLADQFLDAVLRAPPKAS